MGKESAKRRSFNIKMKRKRKEKVRKLREKYLKEKSPEEKRKIIEKIKTIAPHYPLKEILKE